MDFDKRKQIQLHKKDRSIKQEIDRKIQPLVDLINSKQDFFTTSSCSGRVMLLEIPNPKRKDSTKWIYATHCRAIFRDMKLGLKISRNPIWFRQEGAIVHVCCRTIDLAHQLVKISHEAGFKHTGLINAKDSFIVEISSSEKIDAIIAKNGKLVVNGDYLKILINEANQKMKVNEMKLKRLYSLIEQL